MRIEKNKNSCYYVCNDCSKTSSYYFGGDRIALKEAKKSGWHVYNKDNLGRQQHRCPDCAKKRRAVLKKNKKKGKKSYAKTE